MTGNKVHDGHPAPAGVEVVRKLCGAKKRQGEGICSQRAGWGTDHLGSGRCKLHGGASTGPKTPEGKQKTGLNAIKHGAYMDKILNAAELEIYELLFDQTVQHYKLDQENVMHMATLQRACMSYLKIIRLDEWELEEEFEPHLAEIKNPKYKEDQPEHPVHNQKYIEALDPKNIYDEQGNVVGVEIGKTRRIRWAKNAPNWEQHFQNYLKILGTDRSGELKAKQDGKFQSKVVDTLNWLWGGKSIEGDGSNV